MSEQNQSKKFRPRARLLVQLGDRLIRSENIAVVELVKNTYDADAENCEVVFKNIDSRESGEITIKDDGLGMTPQIINEVWLEPGADFKELILDGNQYKLGFDITLPKRTPIGEKGIGRFGVHKLGDYIELVTKSAASDKEVVVEIDWEEFAKEKYLEDAQFKVFDREPQVFDGGKTGTQITVKKLRKVWDKKLYQELQKTLLSLGSPFQEKSDFHVTATLSLKDKDEQSKWSEKLLTLEDIRDKALWRLDCVLEGKKITEFTYKFLPWPEMDKLDPYTLTLSDLPDPEKTIKYKEGNKESVIDLGKYKIGPVRITAYLFDLGDRLLNLGTQDPPALKRYLAANGGVRVYRDGMRVYDYGEAENDWLSLDKTRVNEPVKKIGNRNIIAAVLLDRRASQDLVEKTNREGFVETKATIAFQQAVTSIIDLFARKRNIDKEKIRTLYEGSSKTQPVLHDIDELKSTVEDRLKKVDFKGKEAFTKEVVSNLDRIKDQYIETNQLLLKSAGAGLSLSVVIHEVEKRIKELVRLVESSSLDADRIRSAVLAVSKLIDSYSGLISHSKPKQVSVKRILNDAVFDTDYRLTAHKITIVEKFSESEDFKVYCALNAIVAILINLFDNSIYWLHAFDIDDKKILIDTKHYANGESSIIIADNGKGFTIAPEDALQPFITTKPGGIGLGLHIASEMMKAHKGRLVIRDYKETNLPDEFKNGAIVELIFKN